ncbi:hypothetical protein ScalyP_jg3206 [Parmales sp. scaly parma]|nr:hypothetical protein ScalyP_jg3206 [Parmales sp. scaly parma]
MSKSISALELQRDQLLESQKVVSDKFNNILTKKGGLNETSTLVCRNLQAAIAVAQQPGFFEYHEVSDEAKSVVKQSELKKLTKQIQRIQKEIDIVNSEIRATRPKPQVVPPPTINGFAGWFRQYGEPKPAPMHFMSEFNNDPKIYGGTNHHAGFKTQSIQMRKGHLTR